jgi:pyruvate-formate lyase
VVAQPARTLDEAVNAVWITWVALHMETPMRGSPWGAWTSGCSLISKRTWPDWRTREDRQAYLKHAIELIGCFMMRCTDHLPLTPDFANYYFGGSSSDQAITLGGVTPEGEDAVNDMTYIFLKVTEMLSLRDPNVNARYHPGKTATPTSSVCAKSI